MKDAKDAKEEADRAQQAAKAAYDAAKEKAETAKADALAKKAALVSALDKQQRADSLSLDAAMTAPITDTDFAYLNDFVTALQTANHAAADAYAAYEDAVQELASAKDACDAAKQESARAYARYILLKDQYDAAQKDTTGAENGSANGANGNKNNAAGVGNKNGSTASGNTTESAVTVSTEDQTIADQKTTVTSDTYGVKTGDLSPITGYAVAGLLAVAAFGMVLRKKKNVKDVL